MVTQGSIRGRIERIPLGEIFSTRQFLNCGSRGSVDQALYLLVKDGLIVRLVRGLFVRRGSTMPTPFEVAKAKVESFGKQIYKCGAEAALLIDIPGESYDGLTFACTGRSSKFHFNGLTIQLHGTTPRKLHLRDTLPGLVIRAFWHMGKDRLTREIIDVTYPKWSSAFDAVRQSASLLPWWISNKFNWARPGSRSSQASTGASIPGGKLRPTREKREQSDDWSREGGGYTEYKAILRRLFPGILPATPDDVTPGPEGFADTG